MQVTIVLPIHNEALILERNVARLATRLASESEAEIILVENGSRDNSWDLAQQIERRGGPVRIFAFFEPRAGIGYAYNRGLREVLKRHGPSPERFVALTAADLPFGFSDLDGVLQTAPQTGSRMFVGSKAHPDSVADTGVRRRSMSLAYRLARRLLVGMRTFDSQGSMFVRLDLAHQLAAGIISRDFFYSTELCYFAEVTGETIAEIPVRLEGNLRTSTVRPWRDGLAMARQLLALRRRMGSLRGPRAAEALGAGTPGAPFPSPVSTQADE